jgi:hypothetical protein
VAIAGVSIAKIPAATLSRAIAIFMRPARDGECVTDDVDYAMLGELNRTIDEWHVEVIDKLKTA